jgi:ligand-binding sensor domain-containing protein
MRLIVLLWLLFSIESQAQIPKVFQHFDEKNGLSSNNITAICRDKHGYLWVGTDYGLNRFDGYAFTQYLPDNQLLNKTISSEKINDIKEDNNGFLWIATETGLFCYDTQKMKFQRWLNIGHDDGSLPNSLVTNILADEKDKVWICCDNRDLCYFDTKKMIFKSVPWKAFVNQNVPKYIAKNYKTIYYTQRKSLHEIWLFTNVGLYSFNTENEQFSYFPQPDKKIQPSNCKDNVFIATFTDDFYQLNLCDNSLTQYKLPLSDGIKGEERVVNKVIKVNNSNWILAKQGLFVMDEKTLKIDKIFPDFTNNWTAPFGEVQCSFLEKDGTIWLGGANGLWSSTPENQHFNYYPIHNLERNTKNNSFSNTLYSKYDKRTYVLDFYEGEIIVFEKEKLIKNIHLPSWRCALLKEDSEGTLWCNANDRLFQINREKLTLKEVFIPNELQKPNTPKAYFNDMCEDSDGNLWFSNSEQWIFIWNKNSKTWSKPKIQQQYEPLIVTSLLADKAQKAIWIGTQDYGLIRYDEKSGSFDLFQHDETKPTTSIAGFVVMDIEKDANGAIWAATSPGGVSRFDEKTKTFQNFSTLQGLPSNLVYTLITDNKGNIWGGTNRGLFCIQKDDFHIRTFSQKNGLLSDNIEFSLSKWEKGEIVLSHINGLQYFFPDSLLQEKKSPKILINTFKVFDKNLSDSLNINDLPKGIFLTWKENFFSFDFSSTDFNLTEKNEYAYRLNGFDENWIYCGKRHSISYTNVPPGNYILEIKTGREGIFQEVSFRLPIFIAAPFWQEIWFKILVISLLITMLYAAYRYRIAQIRKEEQLKAEFNERLAKVEMSALRAQMNPHFVFNCLSSINRFILVNQPDEASAYLTKFSRLIRLILDNSRSENVPLDKEIEALRLYIDMEVMRFNNRFIYSIEINDDVALEHIEVPPLLIQPYVENAIWHGLMHREKEGKLKISIFHKMDILYITIEDNGVGRAKAAELKSKSATIQKSHGLQVTAARIDLINQLYNTQNKVFITDLYDKNGEASGTRVELSLE